MKRSIPRLGLLLCAALAGCDASGVADVTRFSAPALGVGADGAGGESTPAVAVGGCTSAPCEGSEGDPAPPLPGPAPAASGCAVAASLSAEEPAQRSLISVRGSTRAASDTSQSALGSCRDATRGPDTWYLLDLRAFKTPLDVWAVLDADFDAAIDLRAGACGDTLSMDCMRARALGQRSSSLALTLEPGSYWLVVDGATAADQGDFQLQLELAPTSFDCSAAAENGRCESALPLALEPRQTLLLRTNCLAPDERGDVNIYYGLDLSAEPEAVLTTLSVWRPSHRSSQSIYLYHSEVGAAACEQQQNHNYLSNGSSLPADVQAQALLAPGRYTIGIVLDAAAAMEDDRAALSVRLDRAACPEGAKANTCEDAEDIDSSPGAHFLEGTTLCNVDRSTVVECEEASAPDRFYRLDLRQAAGPTLVRAAVLVDGTEFLSLVYLLASDGSGGCGPALYCDDTIGNGEGPPHFELTLPPDLYFIAIDGEEPGAAGRYRLLVELAPGEPSPCVDLGIVHCMLRNRLGYPCCYEPGRECPELVEQCGLSPATQACVCQRNAACCGEPGDVAGCAEAYTACQYFCPELLPLAAASCFVFEP